MPVSAAKREPLSNIPVLLSGVIVPNTSSIQEEMTEAEQKALPVTHTWNVPILLQQACGKL